MTTKITGPLDLVDIPVLLENEAQKIVYSNKKALQTFTKISNGWNVFHFQDYFSIYDSEEELCVYQSTGTLYTCYKEYISVNEQVFKKLTLNRVGMVVEPSLMKSYLIMA